jgi:hypothetical protein
MSGFSGLEILRMASCCRMSNARHGPPNLVYSDLSHPLACWRPNGGPDRGDSAIPGLGSERQPGSLCGGEEASRAVHLQFASGTLHLDIVIGSKPAADLAIQRRTSSEALGVPTLKSSFETLTDWATHSFPLRPSARPAIAEIGSF